MTNLAVNSQPTTLNLQAFFGPADYSSNLVMNFVQYSSAAINQSLSNTLAPSSSNVAWNLATAFPAVQNALWFAIYDATQPGQTFEISTVSASGLVTIAPSGFWSYVPFGGSLPTIYLSNTNTTTGVVTAVVFSN